MLKPPGVPGALADFLPSTDRKAEPAVDDAARVRSVEAARKEERAGDGGAGSKCEGVTSVGVGGVTVGCVRPIHYPVPLAFSSYCCE